MGTNMQPAERMPRWDPNNVDKSLDEIHDYVDDEAKERGQWYFDREGFYARRSRTLRLLAISLAAVGGLIPIVGRILQTGRPATAVLGDPLWASLFVGAAAAIVGLDTAFGYSKSWMRYVTTGTIIRGALEEFRLGWVAGRASRVRPAELIRYAKETMEWIESQVLDETRTWAASFAQSLAQVETEVRQQQAGGPQVHTLEPTPAMVLRPGPRRLDGPPPELAMNVDGPEIARRAVELSVMNDGEVDGQALKFAMDGLDGTMLEETIEPGQCCKVQYAKVRYEATSRPRGTIGQPSVRKGDQEKYPEEDQSRSKSASRAIEFTVMNDGGLDGRGLTFAIEGLDGARLQERVRPGHRCKVEYSPESGRFIVSEGGAN